jgi:hypothetical protein
MSWFGNGTKETQIVTALNPFVDLAKYIDDIPKNYQKYLGIGTEDTKTKEMMREIGAASKSHDHNAAVQIILKDHIEIFEKEVLQPLIAMTEKRSIEMVAITTRGTGLLAYADHETVQQLHFAITGIEHDLQELRLHIDTEKERIAGKVKRFTWMEFRDNLLSSWDGMATLNGHNKTLKDKIAAIHRELSQKDLPAAKSA